MIITSAENALSSTHLKPFLTEKALALDLDVIYNVDEAHLIKAWGESRFREAYYDLGRLRTFISENSPMAAYSATMPADTLTTVKKCLHLDPANTVIINKGNFRPNIFWDVQRLSGAESAIPEIKNYLPNLTSESPEIPLTIIFVNTIPISHLVYDSIVNFVPTHLRPQVHIIHSLLSEIHKSRVMREAMDERRGIFVCTEITALASRILLLYCYL